MRIAPALVLLLCVASTLAQPKPAPKPKPWIEMDYGPVLSTSVETPLPAPAMTQKGLLIRLDEKSRAFMMFDMDLMRWSAGWIASETGPINWTSILFDASHRTWPKLAGVAVFGTSLIPGWGKDGSFADPRTKWKAVDYKPLPESWRERGFGPLPADWAKFKGVYTHGQRVILSYTVGVAEVLDSSAWVEEGGIGAFARSIHVSAIEKDLVTEILEAPGAKLNGRFVKAGNLYVFAKGGRLEVDQSHVRLRIAASAKPTQVAIRITSADPDDAVRLVENMAAGEDLAPLIAGGPQRFPQRFTTAGKLGTGEGAYVVDTLTLPTDNPWKVRMRPGGFDFFKDGKSAAVCTWDGDVWRVEGIDDKLEKLTWRRICTGLYQPLGLKIVDEQIYVSCRDQIARLHDKNGDGEIDFVDAFNSDHQVTEHFHEFAMGLQADARGNFYYAKSGRHALDAIVPHHGAIIKVSADGSKSEIIANGHRAANGFGLSPTGEMATSDQEGFWMPANRINLIKPGGFYGNMWSVAARGRTPKDGYDAPLCWIPQTVDRSPAEQLWVTSDKWGPLKGNMLHLSYGMGKLFVVPYEMVDGVAQGGVAAMPIAFPSGIMRGRFNHADGQLYACGLFGWSSNMTDPGGLWRIRYTGKLANLPVGLAMKKDSIVITFTDPLDKAAAEDTANYGVSQWNYLWSKDYGSKQYSLETPTKIGQDTVEVLAASLSADGKTTTLKLAEVKPVMQMKIEMNLKAADGAAVKHVIHGTINRVGR